MNTVNDQETQTFIDLLYERSGRTNGLYTGLYQEWAKLTLQAPADSSTGRASWPTPEYRNLLGISNLRRRPKLRLGQSNSCVDG